MKKIRIINNMTESSFDEENDPADNLDFELDLTPDGIEYMKYSDNLDFEERKNHFNIIKDRQNIINYKNNSNIYYCVDKDGVLRYYYGKNYGIRRIFIPNNVITIGEGAFSDCMDIRTITIPDSVTSIGDHAFSRCSSLESIIIPNSVTSIGCSIFEGCELLKNVFIYSKSFADLMNMKIDILSNEKMLQVICFYSELEPTVEGRFWHYVNGEPVKW